MPYLNSSIDTYQSAISACKAEDKSNVFEGAVLSPLDKFLLRKDDSSQEQTVDLIIHGGMELNVLEAGYTQTLFYLAQVYSQKGDIEQGILYCSQTMTRQMANKTFQTKDFCVNCLNLANYFVLQKNFA